MSWIDDILLQRSELEAPIQFWFWSSITAISAVVKDSVWLNMIDLYKLYPNIYVMLHARSGLRKGPPVNMAKRFVKAINNTHIITGRSSIQGILKEMGQSHTEPGGKIVNRAKAFICSSELSSSIVEDKVAADILTDLYDRIYNEGEWKSLLKMETFTLKDPTITMLTATNQVHSDDFFAKKDVQGGYFARTFIIYGDKRNAINSLVYPLKNPIDDTSSIAYLKELAALRGEFTPLHKCEAGEYYNEWYINFSNETEDTEDETGTLNRFGDSVLKVAMLLALAKEPKLEIDLDSMKEAITHCTKLIGNMRKVTMGKKGQSTYVNQKILIINMFMKREPRIISRSMLLKNLSYHLNANELDEIMRGYDEGNMIKTERHGNAIMYVMTDAYFNEIKSYMEGRNK